jgi:hypothetical protein
MHFNFLPRRECVLSFTDSTRVSEWCEFSVALPKALNHQLLHVAYYYVTRRKIDVRTAGSELQWHKGNIMRHIKSINPLKQNGMSSCHLL